MRLLYCDVFHTKCTYSRIQCWKTLIRCWNEMLFTWAYSYPVEWLQFAFPTHDGNKMIFISSSYWLTYLQRDNLFLINILRNSEIYFRFNKISKKYFSSSAHKFPSHSPNNGYQFSFAFSFICCRSRCVIAICINFICTRIIIESTYEFGVVAFMCWSKCFA